MYCFTGKDEAIALLGLMMAQLAYLRSTKYEEVRSVRKTDTAQST